ncbi:MAG: hypothetical protein WAK18_02145 [Nocardioidaceae bacterium]
MYADAGEAGGAFVPSFRPVRTYVPGTPARDPVRARVEAQRRARTKLRRYCAAHRLNRLASLTYRGEGCHDPVQLRRDVGQFFRSLRAFLGGRPFPYVWVPEWHKTDHGLHVHFAVGRFVPRRLIDAAWNRGWVHIKLLSDLPVGFTSLDEARKAAGYLSKYVTKSFGDDESARLAGLHRYEVAQGFQPVAQRFVGQSRGHVLDQACDAMGRRPSISWFSDDVEDWKAPPAMWFAWD